MLLFFTIITGISIFDYRTGDVLSSQINTEALIELFGKCYVSTTRTALLHYVINRTRDFFLTKRVSSRILEAYGSVS